MKLLIDASMSPAVAERLRALGFDAIEQRAVMSPHASDQEVMAVAWSMERIVVARDYDMGELAIRRITRAIGVVTIAFDAPDQITEADRIALELRILGEEAKDAVITIEAARVRRRPIEQ